MAVCVALCVCPAEPVSCLFAQVAVAGFGDVADAVAGAFDAWHCVWLTWPVVWVVVVADYACVAAGCAPAACDGWLVLLGLCEELGW